MHNSSPNITTQRGITLIEALIALAVISLGILAIAKLYGDLIFSTADSKARTEAVQLAEGEIERLRSAMNRGDFELLADAGPQPRTGTNAEFTITPSVGWDDDTEQNRLDVQMRVEWTDARGDPQSVNISSSVAWMDPRLTTNIAKGRLSEGEDPIARPTGRATTGDDGRGVLDTGLDDADLAPEDRERLLDLADRIDVDLHEEEGVFQVVRDGEALLTTRNAALGSISGRVFLEGGEDDTAEVWRVLSSDAAFCDTEFGSNSRAFGDKALPYFNYVCFFGQGWFGNIGILREESELESGICLGDPEGEGDLEYGDWDSADFQRSAIRRYRGFIEGSDGQVTGSEGLGDGNNPLFMERHDFLRVSLRGNIKTCDAKIDDLPTQFSSEFSGSIFGIAEHANPGRNVCLRGPGLCMDDGDVGPRTETADVILRFQSEDSGLGVEEIMEQLLYEGPGGGGQDEDAPMQCAPSDEWLEEGGIAEVACEVDVPEGASSWRADLELIPNEDNANEVYACNGSEEAELEIGQHGSVSFSRQGNQIDGTTIEFRRIPDVGEIIFPSPEADIDVIELCITPN
ncbi:prepilin-type N-terminal cleavage/methylation domain-containing protein [Thioalkalivibrio sp. ARh3]|uniref:type IV pilus modification PilV family protein n=1 Tax=Thioalkalivibrio sp. ARh3 TaxID=1158148 RepID=UPI000381B1D6|nr:prepilin-type N-terminal cleavage/methylation domain-containing protein [Thioalkalivibrio sp. ARh3]